MKYESGAEAFKNQIEQPEWQSARPDRRSFAAFARHYTNRIHCDGVITDVLFPTGKGLELEIKNEGHDVFLRISNDVPPEFSAYPIDFNFICDSEVFQVNGIIDAKYSSTNLRLIGSGKKQSEAQKAAAEADLKPYAEAIKTASALPQEEKLARIMRRIWDAKPLPYWKARAMGTKHVAYGSAAILRQVINTNIDGITAWDFAVENPHLAAQELMKVMRPAVDGKIIGLGRVVMQKTQRAIVLTVSGK